MIIAALILLAATIAIVVFCNYGSYHPKKSERFFTSGNFKGKPLSFSDEDEVSSTEFADIVNNGNQSAYRVIFDDFGRVVTYEKSYKRHLIKTDHLIYKGNVLYKTIAFEFNENSVIITVGEYDEKEYPVKKSVYLSTDGTIPFHTGPQENAKMQ